MEDFGRSKPTDKREEGSNYGSDDEFNNDGRHSQPREAKHTPQQVLTDIMKREVDFGNPHSPAVDAFHDKYMKSFEDQARQKVVNDPGNILHVLAKDSSPSSSESSKYWTTGKLTDFLHWILNSHPTFLEAKTREGGDYPLHTALKKQNTSFVKIILEMDGLKNIQSVLKQTKSDRNYIHIAIISETPLVFDMAQKCAELKLPLWDSVTTSEKASETPLHVAVRNVLPKHPSMKLTELFRPENDSSPDPLVTQIYKEWQQTVASTRMKREIVTFGNSSTTGTTGTAGPIDRHHPTALSSADATKAKAREIICRVSIQDVGKLLLELVNYRQKSERFACQVEMIQLLIRLCPDSLQAKRTRRKDSITYQETPYQSRITSLKKAWQDLVNALDEEGILLDEQGRLDRDAMRMVIVDDPVADAIRYHCIRHFERDKISQCLYQPGNERHIDFDLAGLRRSSISEAFLRRLGQHLQFESILKYVALPKLALQKAQTNVEQQGSRASRKNSRQDLTDVRAVFQWLRKNNVKRILKVTVVDYGTPCHSDAIIEEALRDFEVEIWDWKKVDLCTDVISASTKMARHVSLYSSCNKAVLMGWASSDGLGDAERFPKLERVQLFIGKGQEGDRREQYIAEFENKIRALKDRDIQVEHHLDDGKVSFAADFKNNDIPEQQQIKWIDLVENFAIFMENAHPKGEIEPVKIAIIDDGADASLEFIVEHIAAGKSFCPYANSSDLMNAYYVPSGRHGTMMADLICRVCPSARLYIARLDERPTRSDSGRQITIQSAVEAINWAVQCQVDIISMSWTIDGTDAEPHAITDLEKAITNAKTNGVLMFCTMSDNGSIASDQNYPARSGESICIGAATAFGDKCTWVPPGGYDFLLPGKNVPFRWEHRDEVSSWEESGSSLATALAAGLAGLIIYCDRAVTGNQNSVQRDERLHTKAGMMRRFGKLAQGSKGHKFLRADTWFGTKFRHLVKNEPCSSLGATSNSRESPGTDGLEPLSEMEWNGVTEQALRRLLLDMDQS